MEKIKISILSFTVILVLGGAMESYAQFSFAGDSCRTSFLYSAFNKGSSSLPSTTFTLHAADKEGLTTFEKILNVPLGILFGSFAGFLIGNSLPPDHSDERLFNGIKGGLIGAFAGPFVNYEILSAMKGARNPLNKWYFKAGGNIILPNYEDVIFKPGYSIGISRYFPLSNIISLQGNFTYQARQ
ncbi:MAG TPA: hypothetical protein VGD14_24980, partial [bacterium]